MALEFICSDRIESEKRIVIPRSANAYRLDFKNYGVEFYFSNPGISETDLAVWDVPMDAREVAFKLYEDNTGGHIFLSTFYDKKGNVLKIGSR